MARELQARPKEAESPFAAQALLIAKAKTEENTGEAYRIFSAALFSFREAGIKNSEIERVLAEIRAKGKDVKVSFGVQYG